MSSAAGARSALRDSLNRLKSIRQRCGKNDEESKDEINTGDKFRDKCTMFSRSVKKLKDQIVERNAGAKKNGQDGVTIEQSHEIAKGVRDLEVELKEIKALVEESDKDLAKANRKKKAASTITLLERQVKDRQSCYTNCEQLLEATKTMNLDRFSGGDKKGATPQQQVTLGKKLLIRQQLMNLKPGGSAGGAEGGAATDDSPARRLEDDPEAMEQKKMLEEQEKKINAGLNNVGKAVGRLKDIAYQIGSELDVQNRMLDAADNKVESQTKQLRQLNRRLGKMIKETKPANMLTNVGCVLVLLALVGYFLYEFGVVK